MRKLLIILLTLLLICGSTTPALAQKNHKGKASVSNARNHKANGKASSKHATSKSRSANEDELEEEEDDTLHLSIEFLEATQKIIFVDSMVVDSATFLNHIHLDSSCGKMLYANALPPSLATNAVGIAYVNGFGDRLIFAQKQKDGSSRLMESYLFGADWSAPVPLKGIDEANTSEDAPFVMDDGTTLYFRRDSSIFLTRYSSDDKEFLTPENIGLPFNYPAANLLLCIDEVNQLGWFVSNRHQPNGKVCIYVFIPTDTRDTYDSSLSRDSLTLLASIHSIAATQINHQADVKAARERLAKIWGGKNGDVANGKSPAANGESASVVDLNFDVANGITYHKIEDFRNAEARKLAGDWVVENFRRTQLANLLQENRNKYGASNSAAEKKALAAIILRQEHELESMDSLLPQMANKIRKLEQSEKR